MKNSRFLTSAAFVLSCAVAWANQVTISTDRFSVTAPEGFVGQAAQANEVSTRWTYTREIVPKQLDYWFRISVVNGRQPAADGLPAGFLADLLIGPVTTRLSQTHTDLKCDDYTKVKFGGRVWFKQNWTGKFQGKAVHGTCYAITAKGSVYYVEFETFAASDDLAIQEMVLSTFAPKPKNS